MTLQSSGQISLLDISTEFGGTAPHSLSEYYGVDSGIPSSGQISIGDFYGASNAPTPPPPASSPQVEYTSAGTYSWTCPAGVTSVSVVCIGAGGTGGAYGGSGGSLAYKNNISVTPGTVYTVVVGATNSQNYTSPYNFPAGDSSAFGTVAKGGLGGYSGFQAGTYQSIGSNYDGGGRGGLASADFYQSGIGYRRGAGGGAGGYSGDGGNAGKGDCTGTTSTYDSNRAPTAGSGGGGGGGTPHDTTYPGQGSGGGGTGIYGQGSNGAAGVYSTNLATTGGGGGSGGGSGGNPYGGQYGGGSAGIASATPSSTAQCGAVRIIWPGDQRQFPSTRTADE